MNSCAHIITQFLSGLLSLLFFYIPLMHEMQCVENIMSCGLKNPHTKSDDKGIDTSNKQE